MKIAIFKKTCAQAGIPVMEAFIKSLSNEDYQLYENHERPDADVVVIWSVLLNLYNRKPIYDYYTQRGTKILVLEVGGIKRNESWRIGINGINRDAEYGNQNVDDKRLERLGLETKPWKQGEDIILCTQNEYSAAWPDIKMSDWVEKTVKWIRSTSKRRIWLRPHPRHRINFDKILNSNHNVELCVPKNTGNKDEVDFEKYLSNAFAVVNYNSNPAIESVLAGVPVFVDKSSLCWSVGNPIGSDIEKPIMPNRTKWLQELSYCEWFVDEIEKGLPWARIKPLIK